MAQTSDNNNSNGNSDIGTTDAEQILDSIIEHIEGSDELPGADAHKLDVAASPVLPSDDMSPAAQESDAEPSENADPKNNLLEIEARAAQLATMLGGAGLSYSEGAEKHLADMPYSEEQEPQENIPTIEASIHDDDVQMDNRAIAGPLENSSSDIVERQETYEQEKHIDEWEADAHREQNENLAEPIEVKPELEKVETAEPVAVENYPENQSSVETIESPVLDEMQAEEQARDIDIQNEIVEVDPTRDATPDLQNIEQQIEALSLSMKDQDGRLDDQQVNEPASADLVPVREGDATATADVYQRVASLEGQIVQLLDRVSLSEQHVEESVVGIVRTETQKAVQEAIHSSDLIGALRAELTDLGVERKNQEQRMSDSLDILHDALKDLGDRVKTVEYAAPIEENIASEVKTIGGGIASSVLSSQLVEHATKEKVEVHPEVDAPIEEKEEVSKAPTPIEASPEEAMPTWLEDATEDLHRQNKEIQEEPADVFATKPVNEANQIHGEVSPVEEKLHKDSSLAEQFDESDELFVEDKLAEQLVDEPVDEPVEEMIAPVSREDVVDAVALVNPEPELPAQYEPVQPAAPQNETNFLSSARAAARAANERARITQEEIDQASNDSLITKTKSNFIAAARKKQLESEVDLVPPVHQKEQQQEQKAPAKNSLFQDKVEGPNSLLVFTSLILFGTSALLLYGMSKNEDKGSITTLNAVEQKMDQMKAGAQPSSVKQVGADHKDQSNKTDKKRLSKKPRSGERSGLEGYGTHNNSAKVNLANVQKRGEPGYGDTLTTYDRLVQSRMAALSPVPSPVDITGSLSEKRKKSGSLFDEYVSFSSSSNSNRSNSPSSKFGTMNSSKRIVSTKTFTMARNGDAIAQYQVARRYSKGLGVEKSPAISIEWYEKSANAGYAPAIYRLATMYERGNGVAKNYKKAMELYLQAAGKGNVKAMHNLAVLYTGGNLGKADYTNAIKWYGSAAEYGVKDSQFNLAIIYQNGMGGAQDLAKAYKWYSLAARSGDREAKELKLDIREEFSASQLRVLDADLDKWLAKTPDKATNSTWKYSQKSVDIKVAGQSRSSGL